MLRDIESDPNISESIITTPDLSINIKQLFVNETRTRDQDFCDMTTSFHIYIVRVRTTCRRLFAFIGHRPHLLYPRLSHIDQPNCSQVTGRHQRCRSLWYFDYVITDRCETKLVSKFQDESTFRNNDKYPVVLFLLPPIFLVANRTESILRGQPPVCLRNAIIMRLIIGANFCLLAAARRFAT